MAGQTIIEYGGSFFSGDELAPSPQFVMYNCVTDSFNTEIVMDPSGTDAIYHRHTMRFSGYIHAEDDWIHYHKLILHLNSAALEQRSLRTFLEPRRGLRVRVGVTDSSKADSGEELIRVIPYPANIANAIDAGGSSGLSYYDVADGPKCTNFSIKHVTGNSVFRVSVEFVVCQVECDNSTYELGTAINNTRSVLSHRWSSTDEIGEDYYTTRTYSGTAIIATSRIDLHRMRTLVVPPLCRGMKRESMSFTVTPDGRTLQYTVRDREVAYAPPYPATSMEITSNANTTTAPITTLSCNVSLTGDRNVNPRLLITAALAIVGQRLGIRNQDRQPGVPNPIGKRLTITEHLGQRIAVEVSAEVTVQSKGVVGQQVVVNSNLGRIGTPIDATVIPNYDRNLSRGARAGEFVEIDGPVTLVGLFKSFLQSPCDNAHRIDQVRTLSNGIPLNDASPGPPIRVFAMIDGVNVVDGGFSPSHGFSVYTHYQCESQYSTNELRVAMPVSSGSAGMDSVKVVRLSRGVTHRTVRVTAERAGMEPELPKPGDYQLASGGTVKVLKHRYLPGTTDVAWTGERLYRAQMEIDYVLTRSVAYDTQLRVGKNPWDQGGLQFASPYMFIDENTAPT